MASQSQIIQGKNSFFDAVQQSLTNVGRAVGQGFIDSDTRTLAANKAVADDLGAQVKGLYERFGGWAFDPRAADSITDPRAAAMAREQTTANMQTLNAYLQAREKAAGRPMAPEERDAFRATLTMQPSPLQQDAFMKSFFMPDYASASAAPSGGGGNPPPATAVATPPAGMPSDVAAKVAPVQAPIYDPRIQAAMSFLPGAYRERLVQAPQQGASLGPGMGRAPSAMSYSLSPALQTVLQEYKTNPQAQALLSTQFRKELAPNEVQGDVARRLEDLYREDPILAEALYKAAIADYRSSGNQLGVKANGTRTLAQHERATGDVHHPALVGEREGIINAVAMGTPGVAQIVMELNRRFPANVAASRGAHPNGTLPFELSPDTPTLDDPSVEQAFRQVDPRVLELLNQVAAETSGQAQDAQAVQRQASAPLGPQYMNAPTPGTMPFSQNGAMPGLGPGANAQYMSTKGNDGLTPITALEQKGVLVPPPTPSEKAQLGWDRVRQHAADVQAKYQINFVNPDPREKAILARELAIENNLVKQAMAQDPDRKKWMQEQSKRLSDYLRNASDEEIALTFGDGAAQARDRSKTRDIENAKVQIMREQVRADKDTQDKFLGTLAMQAMQSAADIVKASIGKDKDGRPVWDENMFNKMSSNVPWVKSMLDINQTMMGVNAPGVAEPTTKEKFFMFWPTGKFEFDFDKSGMAQSQAAAAAAPKTSTESAADAAMKSGRF